ncbi:MAG: hypothetical protein ACJ8DC_10805 [Gemmatimonadales bacterium]
MNRARLLVLAFAALAAGGCADNILKERPATRTVKTAPTNKVAFSVNSRGQSTVCGSYRRQLAQIKRAELKAAGQQLNELKARELSLNAVIADACE